MSDGVTFHDFSAGGAVGALIRDKDWSETPLGARASWPRSLSNHVSMILELPTAAIIFWGPDRIQLYNDGYSVIMGPRHPRYLGATFRDCWPEAYDAIDPWMQRVLQRGETVEVNRTIVPLTRYGFVEDAYFTFSFSPLRDDAGNIAGILQLVTEVTGAVLGERRAAALHDLSEQTSHAKTPADAIVRAMEVLARHANDLPFCLLYLVDGDTATLAGSTGLVAGHAPFPDRVALDGRGPLPELGRVVHDRAPVAIDNLERLGPLLLANAAPSPTRALASPILSADQQRVDAVVIGAVSPRLRLDEHYRAFLELVSAQLSTLLAAARAYDDERKRAEALAELDRAKTEFFSNVSHEFRTPLTLLLGPVEEALKDPSHALRGDGLAIVHRNALRLLRLVNTLLDFARIEANRLTSTFELTDLSALTAGLAGSFQSLLSSAGLRFRVDCPPLSELVYIDRAQWEKIVLNLVTNAFKFTFEGEIVVELREQADGVQLVVRDTGIGIAAKELPKIFERFHRVKGARGRSFEGTGIGLALVRELVKQHGGTVEVESTVGTGTTFSVSIPKRRADAGDAPAAPIAIDPSQLEAHWTAPARPRTGDTGPQPPGTEQHGRILVVDDNADMRDYIVRLLAPMWAVDTAEDGQAAYDAVLAKVPDLIVSDVMMPRMDGGALVNALRANPKTATIPIMLLSARAGEDALVDGYEIGADDYLVKPFAARELIARVRTHIQMERRRKDWARQLQHVNEELEAFSYTVSHDLRAPLRAIDGFSRALAQDYASALDAQGHNFLERVRSNAQRMGQLIDDLLKLSRLGRTAVVRERIDIGAMAQRILAELREREPGRDVDVTTEGALAVDADPRLVAVVMDNLLSNAWKFTSKQTRARIEVGSEKRDGELVLFVRDNGAGFAMDKASTLFRPFQRLHTQTEFEGTGIGLATVQRIVSRHGGRIWADAAPDRGASFYFTLSAR